ncbi:MAG: ABC transporter ATP-binding protein [Acidobacteria bacterium]|nr:ABC transporter ATP-binding protein [Acidobacteriota bacterium]MCB9397575.1 ABC transporter ATP-binding protein [Acidobacteriota bacterium]
MKQLLLLLVPHKWRFFGAIFALLIAAVFTAAMTATTKPLLENILTESPQTVKEHPSRGDQLFAYQDKLMSRFKVWLDDVGLDMGKLSVDGKLDLNNPLPWSMLVLILFLGQAIADFWGTFTMGRIGIGVVVHLRQSLMDKVMRLPLTAFRQYHTGELLSRINNDVSRVQVAISVKMGELFKEGATALAALVFLFVLSWQLSMTLFILVPLVAGPIFVLSRKIRKNAQRSQVYLGNMSSHLKEVLVGMRIVKAFGKEAFESNRLQEANQRFYKYALRELRSIALTMPVIGFVGILIIVGFISLGSFLIQTTQMTNGDFMVFVLFVYQLYQPIKRIARANSEIQQAVGVLPRIDEILNLPNEEPDPALPKRPPQYPNIDCLAFENVGFAYDESEQVLSDINFEVRRGQVVALVGPSGGGKSTLVNLLPRFFEISSGSISIDGVEIRQMAKNELRTMIGIVTQDTILFNDTVHNNIAYGLGSVPREAVEKAAEQANALDFVQNFPEGFDTRIGEAGARLSGGQKQRLSIARAILKNAPILILDEATSALDTESERMVQTALENLMQNKTAIVIAHRLSTIRKADLILFLDKGKIVERGNHETLMAHGKSYKRWVAMQEGGADVDEHDGLR